MDDLIRRQALKDAMYHEAFETDSELQKWDSGCWIRYKMFENVINDAPSAQQWIPCSERLPSMGERVVVSAVHHKTEDVVIDILRYHGKKYGWEYKDICTAVAWMPLPEPYKVGEK